MQEKIREAQAAVDECYRRRAEHAGIIHGLNKRCLICSSPFWGTSDLLSAESQMLLNFKEIFESAFRGVPNTSECHIGSV